MNWCAKCNRMVSGYHKHWGPADYRQVFEGPLVCARCDKPVANNNVECKCKVRP